MAEDAKSYFRRKSEDSRIERGYESGFTDRYGNRIQKEVAPVAPPTEGRSFGFRSGAASVAPGGIANQRLGEAVEAGKSLGEPTSFKGGAGAPAPVGVIRGMRQTFATDTGGPQMSEFATPEQAGQAWNRAERGKFVEANPTRENLTYPAGTSPEEQATKQFGEWRPEGQTKGEIIGQQQRLAQSAENKSPERLEQAKFWQQKTKGEEEANRKNEIQQNQAIIRNEFEAEHGDFNPATKNYSLPADPELMGIFKKTDTLAKQGVSEEEINKTIMPDIHRHYYTPENIHGAISLMEKQKGSPLSPEKKSYLFSGKPDAMEAAYDFIRQHGKQPKPGFMERTFGGGQEQTSPVTPAQGTPASAFQDPALQNLEKAGKYVSDLNRGAGEQLDRVSRGFNRGVRNVVPGSSYFIDEKGNIKY